MLKTPPHILLYSSKVLMNISPEFDSCYTHDIPVVTLQRLQTLKKGHIIILACCTANVAAITTVWGNVGLM